MSLLPETLLECVSEQLFGEGMKRAINISGSAAFQKHALFAELLALLIILRSTSAERSYLSLQRATNPEQVEWDTKSCKRPLTDISFAPPGSSGLTTGALTLSSVSIGQMSTMTISEAQDYSSLPIRLHKLPNLNKYGTCLGLREAKNVMEWARLYSQHLGAKNCGGKARSWGPCSFALERQASELNRQDFVLVSPTVMRPLNRAPPLLPAGAFRDRHFAATTIILPKKLRSARHFWRSVIRRIDSAKKKSRRKFRSRNGREPANFTAYLQGMPKGVMFFHSPARIAEYQFRVEYKRPVAAVCVCDKEHFYIGNREVSTAYLASWLVIEDRDLEYYEPGCNCHTMDVALNSSVKCPLILDGMDPHGVLKAPNIAGDFSQLYAVARDAPYLRPYLSQTGNERCFSKEIERNACSKDPSPGTGKPTKRIVSCGVLSSGMYTFFLGFANKTGIFEETPAIRILRLLTRGDPGEKRLVQMLSTAKGFVVTGRVFNERLADGLREHPDKLSAREFWLLVALPAAAILTHFLYELSKTLGILCVVSTSKIEGVLLALLDLAVESTTAAFLWVNVKRQRDWQYERCLEVPFTEDMRGETTVELLVTQCTQATMKPDFTAAIVATIGAASGFALLCLVLGPRLKRLVIKERKVDPSDVDDADVLELTAIKGSFADYSADRSSLNIFRRQ